MIMSLKCPRTKFFQEIDFGLYFSQEHLESSKYVSRAILVHDLFLRLFMPLRQPHGPPHSNTSSSCCSTPSFPFPLLLLCPFPFPFFAPFSCSPIATSSAYRS